MSSKSDCSLYRVDGNWIYINSIMSEKSIRINNLFAVVEFAVAVAIVVIPLFILKFLSLYSLFWALMILSILFFQIKSESKKYPVKINILTRTGYTLTPLIRYKIDLSDVKKLCIAEEETKLFKRKSYFLCGETSNKDLKTIVALPDNWEDCLNQLREIAEFLKIELDI